MVAEGYLAHRPSQEKPPSATPYYTADRTVVLFSEFIPGKLRHGRLEVKVCCVQKTYFRIGRRFALNQKSTGRSSPPSVPAEELFQGFGVHAWHMNIHT